MMEDFLFLSSDEGTLAAGFALFRSTVLVVKVVIWRKRESECRHFSDGEFFFWGLCIA
jgi:hypothetical protein